MALWRSFIIPFLPDTRLFAIDLSSFIFILIPCLSPVGETGVYGDALEVKTEKDIFDYLDMEYRPPEER